MVIQSYSLGVSYASSHKTKLGKEKEFSFLTKLFEHFFKSTSYPPRPRGIPELHRFMTLKNYGTHKTT